MAFTYQHGLRVAAMVRYPAGNGRVRLPTDEEIETLAHRLMDPAFRATMLDRLDVENELPI